VSAFIERLVGRYSGLLEEVERLRGAIAGNEREDVASTPPEPDHNDSAKKEAELIIAEAERQGEEIVQERAAAAEQRASDIARKAEDDAAAVRADARREADELIAEAKRKVETAERQADEILKEAAAVAESARAVAEEESRRLVEGIRRKTDQLTQDMVSKAEDEGRLIIERATEVARAEAERITEEARQMLLASKQLLEMQAAERCDTPPLRGADDSAAAGASGALYEGTVELAICPPIVLDRVVKLHRHLKRIPQIKVMDVSRSDDRGLQMRLHVPQRTPLIEVLKAFPEISKVAIPRREVDPGLPGLLAGGKSPVRKVFVTTRQ